MSVQRFFNQTGTLKNRTGYDQYGKEVQTAGTSVNLRFEEVNKTRIMPDGSVETVTAVAYIDPSVSINIGDHFIFNGNDYRVLTINIIVDGNGRSHHTEASLSKWQS